MPDSLTEAGTEDFVLDTQEALADAIADVLAEVADVLPSTTHSASTMANNAFGSQSKLFAFTKRAFDLVVTSGILLVTSPILILIAIAIKVNSSGDVLFLQDRYGKDGQTFCIYKFRTMFSHMTDRDAVQQTKQDDKRITWVGGFLRSHSLDELPQLLNVLLGNMSLVGPRPHATGMVVEEKDLTTLDNWAARYVVKPGITGWAQVNGSRGGLFTLTDAYQRLDYDLQYIDNQSFWLDVKIVLRTVKVFLKDNRAV